MNQQHKENLEKISTKLQMLISGSLGEDTIATCMNTRAMIPENFWTLQNDLSKAKADMMVSAYKLSESIDKTMDIANEIEHLIANLKRKV